MLDTTRIPHGQAVYHGELKSANIANESLWFKAFLSHTNQKSKTAKAIAALLELISFQDEHRKLSLLDIGCGEGELSSGILESIKTYKFEKYVGIDSDSNFLDMLRARFQEKRFELDLELHHSNCFEFDYSSLGQHSVILLSNILYYCSDIGLFANTVLKGLGSSGIAIFVHESNESIPKLMRKKYGANISDGIPTVLQKQLSSSGYGLEEFEVKSNISFKRDISSILRNSFNYAELSMNLTMEEVLLLEFVAQTSLQQLEQKSCLSLYIDDIAGILAKNDNCIPVTSCIQAVKSK